MHVICERYFPLLNCDVYFANVQVCVCICVCVHVRACKRESRQTCRFYTGTLPRLNVLIFVYFTKQPILRTAYTNVWNLTHTLSLPPVKLAILNSTGSFCFKQQYSYLIWLLGWWWGVDKQTISQELVAR